MKKLIKLLLGLVVLAVVVIGAAAVVLPKYINPNDYKDRITAQVEKATGRKLILGGDLKLTVFPWLGVDLGQVSLGNAAGFGDQPMVAAEKLSVRVQLLPLLLKRILLMDTVALDGASINLARDKQGKTNFDDLMGARGKQGEPQKVQLAALVLNGLDVKKTQFIWDDQSKGEKYVVRDLNLHTGELSFSKPIPVTLSTSFDAPASGIGGDISLKSDVQISADAQQVRAAPLEFSGRLKGKAVPGGSSDVKLNAALDLDLKAGTLKLADLDAKGLDATLKGNLDARNIRTPTPAVSGKIDLQAADGPKLVEVLSALTGRTRHAGGTAPLTVSTALEADLKGGTIKLSDLTANTAGTEVKGGLDARNMQGKDSSVSGKLTVTSADVNALLKAYGVEPPVAEIKNLNATTTVSGSARHFKLEPITLTASASGPVVPKGGTDIKLATRADVDLDRQTAQLADLSLEGLGLNARGNLQASGIMKEPRLGGSIRLATFNLRQLLGQLGVALPEMADANTLTRVSVDSQVAGSAKDVSLTGMKLMLDDSNVAGDVSVSNFVDPAVGFNLKVDAINADRYLPPRPPEGQDAKGGAPAPAAAAGPGPGAAAAAPTRLPVETLRKLRLKGDASISQLTVRNLRLSNVRVGINARDGDARMSPIAANLYEGSYAGNIAVDARGQQPVLSLDHALTGIQVEPLLKDLKGKSKLRGKGDFSLKATGAGGDTAAIKRSLNGQGAFRFQNGAVKGFNIGKFMRKAQTGFIGKVDPAEETDFAELKGTFNITNGVLHNEDLTAKSPLLRVDGKGNADLAQEVIDYIMNVNVVATTEGQGGKELADLAGLTVPFKISGTFDDPSFAPDVAGIVKAKAEKEIQKQLDKQLKGKLPGPAAQLIEGVFGGKQEAAAPPPASPQQAPAQQSAPPPQNPPADNNPADALKKLLKF